MERINKRKRKRKDPLIIPTIFIFFICREKAHGNKEFSREISKPLRKS